MWHQLATSLITFTSDHVIKAWGKRQTGPLEAWTYFWAMFWTFLWTFLSWTNLSGKGRPLALRERWDAVYRYSGRGWRQTVVTEGRVEDELLVRKEGWKVIVLLNTTDWWSFHWSIQVILIGFWLFYVKIFALGRTVSWFFCDANEKLVPKH